MVLCITYKSTTIVINIALLEVEKFCFLNLPKTSYLGIILMNAFLHRENDTFDSPYKKVLV